MSSPIRLTGMASGLDVDSIVKQMMTPYNTQVDKVKQDKQILQWKQDAYRDILGDFNTFKSTYFDVLKQNTYMLGSNNYAGFDVVSADSSSSTAVPSVTATAGSGAAAGTYSVSNVVLAAKASSNSAVTNISQADNAVTNFDFSGGNNGINIKLYDSSSGNIVNTTININSFDNFDINSLASDINSQLTGTSLDGKLEAQVSADGTKIQFSAKTNGSINISNASGGNVLSRLGFSSSSFDINQTVNDKISNIFNGTTAAFSIKSDDGTAVNFNYDFSDSGDQKDWTIFQVLSDINSKAGVNASYNELSRKFSLSSNKTGSNESINVTDDTNGFMNKLFGTTAGSAFYGTDASATITNPQGISATVIKSSNSFNIDGVNYNLVKNNSTTSTNITITSNVQKTFDKIKAFIDKYNDVIDKISTKLNEKKQSGYPPLTDDQKKGMTADEIKLWEDNAKQGLIRNDSNLQSMLVSMRSSFFSQVDGAGISLSSIGLSTSSDYTQGGKIIIDESKLKNAIQNNGTQVANLLMQQSSKQPNYSPNLSAAQRNDRNNSEGIFQRINDILQDFTRTTRDANSKKGTLIELAGIKGDFTEFKNLLSTQMTDKDKQINDLVSKLNDRENSYYTKFSKLETAMSSFNSQSSWLTQQISKM